MVLRRRVEIDQLARKVEMYRYRDLWERMGKCSAVSLKVLLYFLMNRCNKEGVFTISREEHAIWGNSLGMRYAAVLHALRGLVSLGLLNKLYNGVYQVDRNDFAVKAMAWDKNPKV